jgi:predicted ATPase
MQVAGFTLEQVIHAIDETVVAAARDAAGERVVLKLLDTDQPSPSQLARWRHEFSMLQALASPWVIQAKALLPAGRSLVLVLEGFGQCNLEQLIERQPLDLGERLQLAIQLTQALASVHQMHLLHGDVAPKNVLVDLKQLRLKLCDFGLSSRLDREHRAGPAGFVQGTLAYVAPEQTGRTNLDIDQRSDFYALGATLYQLFCGQPPLQGDNAMALLHAQLAIRPQALHERAPALPEVLSAIVGKLLEKAPDDRYQSSHGLLCDLQQCQDALQAHGHIAPFAVAQHDVPERFTVSQRLIGREAQNALLLAAFERASSGPAELLLLSGSAGIGKTALATELHRPVVARRGYFLRGKCDQYQRNRPYAALSDAFGPLMQQLAVEGRNLHWREQLGAALGEQAGAVAALLPELKLLIGEPPPLTPLPAHETERRMHLAFARFVQALAQPQHPLLLLLDDLQWADAATLQLLEHVLSDDSQRALLVVGAFREAEVDAQHPLRALQMALLAQGNERLNECFLGPLRFDAVHQLISDTLRCPPDRSHELAQLCMGKTAGNPFFLVQFLRQLHEQGLLHYVHERGAWDWDLAAIERLGMTDNVVELMLGQLRLLPASTQQLLAHAAGLGDSFSGAELMALSGLSAQDSAMRLWPALSANLVQALSENYRFSDSPEQLAQARYRFLHDRVQQAAHELTPPAERAALQLQTGRLLLVPASPDELEHRLFTLLAALNAGSALITDAAERAALRALNLRGARKAAAASAQPLCAQLARQALELQPEDDAERLQTYLLLTQAEYLAGRFDIAEALYADARAACPAPMAQAQLLAMQADQFHIQGRFDDAFGVLREALFLLGETFPASEAEAMAAFPGEFGEVLAQLNSLGMEALLQVPEMQDSTQALVQRLLYALSFSTYQTARFGGFVLDACRQLRITLRHGQNDLSAIACAAFVTAISAAKLPYTQCYQLGELALRLAEQRGNAYVRLTVYQYFNAFYQHWGAPLQATLAPQDRGFELGLSGINPLSAGYCALLRCVNRFIVGTPLPEVLREAERSLKYLQSSRQSATLAMLRHGVWLPLRALTDTAALDEAADQHQALLRPDATPSIPWAMASTAQLRHAVLMDEEAGWRICAERLPGIAACLPDSPSFVEASFYVALGALRWNSDQPKAEAHIEQLGTWAQGCEANFLPRQLLLKAELAGQRAQAFEAMALFAMAIDSAREHEQLVLEALGNEMYARFWQQQGQIQLAKQFVREAYHLYRHWGATSKCRQLERSWPQESFRVSTLRGSGSSNLSSRSQETGSLLGLQAVLKAHEVLAQEIHLDALLPQMLAVLLEHAGAERGAIVLNDEGRLVVETLGGVGPASRRIEARRLSLPLEEAAEQLPVPLLDFVRLTRQLLVINLNPAVTPSPARPLGV